MPLLLAFLFLALGVSFICSIIESVLLTATPSYIETLKPRSPRRAALLAEYKQDIDRPLAAILSLNTVAHTVGAAGVGAEAMKLYGESYLALISAVLTFLILILSEIIPKTLGARYWKPLLLPLADVLRVLIFLAYPLVLISRGITRLLSGGKSSFTHVSREEIGAMAAAGHKSGVLHRSETAIVRSLLASEGTVVRDIMTPRTVMFTLPAAMPLADLERDRVKLPFSRIPVWKEDGEDIDHYVLKDDLLAGTRGPHRTVADLMRPLTAVPESAHLLSLFSRFLQSREHLALVVDEYGGVAGIVTMEDILESLLGVEIVDEDDRVVDMQQFARHRAGKH